MVGKDQNFGSGSQKGGAVTQPVSRRLRLSAQVLETALLFSATRQLELSTNLAENAIRPIARGRKNWIHLGCEGAGPRIAAIISLIETCRRLQTRPRDYFL
jgi:hypothetical protein